MRILLVSDDFSAADLLYRLKKEGHQVMAYIKDPDAARAYSGIVTKVKTWRKYLSWVGKDGLIVFDGTGYGKVQDALRKQGYSVVGGSEAGDHCEDDRTYGQKVFWICGMNMIPCRDFSSLDEAIRFVKKHPKAWVIKQNGHASKIFNYVGQLEDGSDVISVLESYRKNAHKKDLKKIQLQERIYGVEIGIGRYFNGNDWVGPIEMNIEHKNLSNGDLGPKTYEMGTLMWFDNDEKNRLYQETLAKMKDYLTSIDFRGDVDINCIVNEKGVYPLEITARFGFPALQLQQALSPEVKWGEFLKAVADGKQYDFRFKKGEYGIIALVALPPFPYADTLRTKKPVNVDIFFDKDMDDNHLHHIHLEEVSRRRSGGFYVSGVSGFALHVSGRGMTIGKARDHAYSIMRKVTLPKMFYRTDIGLKFEKEDRKKLKKWGYMK